MIKSNNIRGAALSLRLEYIDEILEKKPDLPFLEIITENWFSKGPHHQKLKKIREIYPISFHCVGMNLGGNSQIQESYLLKVKNLMREYDPFIVSDHLCFQNSSTHHYHDLLPFPFNEDSLKSTIKRVKFTQDFLEKDILVENLSYYVKYKDSTLCEVDFLNELINEAKCSLLLDLNNIWVNDKNGIDNCNEFIKKIQWNKVSEIHVAGPELVDGILIDTHGSSVHQEVLKLIKENKDDIKNLPLIYERDNQLPEFEGLLKELEIIKRHL